jgi:phosphomannomutase
LTQVAKEALLRDPITGLMRPTIKVKFGTAGIRGVYGQDVSIKETIAVCFAVNSLLGQGKFGVGYDSRRTSFILSTVACSAMNWYGSNVEDYGMIPTPVLAFNIKQNNLHAGFSVTASHNPPEFAGVKVFGTEGIEFSLEAEQKLELLSRESNTYTKKEEELGQFGSTFDNEEAVYSYNQAVIRRIQRTLGGAKKSFKILVDCANGTSGQVTPKILPEFGHQVITVNAHPSHNFPGRLPEPMLETLGEVALLAKAIGVDFVIAHDGDADRLVMITGEGEVVPDYALSTLILKIIIERAKHGSVIISLNSSNALEQVALEAGCRVQRSRLGKTFQELYRGKGIFASEPSKIVDPTWGYWEDGIYAGVMVTQYLAERNLSLHEALQTIPKYFNFQKNLSLSSFLDYGKVRSEVEKRYSGQIDRIEGLDGVKVHLKGDDSWFMLRSSGTEKKVRVYVESKRESEAKSLLEGAVSIAYSSQTTGN